MAEETDVVRSKAGVVLRVFDRSAPPPASTVDPELTIQALGRVTFNRAAMSALGFPAAVEFLFSEEEERIIGVRAADPDSSRSFRVRAQGKGSSYQTSGESFIKGCGIPHERATRYKAELDGDMLLADLKEGGVDVSQGRQKQKREGG